MWTRIGPINQWSPYTYKVVYYHTAASGWIITGNTIIQLHNTRDMKCRENMSRYICTLNQNLINLTWPYFQFQHSVVAPSREAQTWLNTAAQLQIFPCPKLSKLFPFLNLTCFIIIIQLPQTTLLTSVMDKKTKTNEKLVTQVIRAPS